MYRVRKFLSEYYASMSSGYPAEWTRRANRQMIHRLISNTRGKNSIKSELWPWSEKKNIIHLIVVRVRIKPLDMKSEIKIMLRFYFSFC